jgi:hypothetical protein
MPRRKFILPRNNDGEGLPQMMKKPQLGKQRPERMLNTAWAADVAWRAIVNHDQRKREVAAKMKKAAAATAASYGPPLPRHLWDPR